MKPPLSATTVWVSDCIHVLLPNGENLTFPVGECKRFVAFMQARHLKMPAKRIANEAEIRWEQAIRRDGDRRRRQEEERAARADKRAARLAEANALLDLVGL